MKELKLYGMRDPKQKVSVDKDGQCHVETISAPGDEGVPPTQQQFKEECDINNIMTTFQRTGQFPHHLQLKKGVYADLSNITDYRDMVHTIQYAEQAFMALPASTRSRFKNDPNELISFLRDPSNNDEAVKLKLINPPEPIPNETNLKPNEPKGSKKPIPTPPPAES